MKNYLVLFAFNFFYYLTYAQEPVAKSNGQKENKTLEKDGKDPVCGMKVKKGTTFVRLYKEKQHGFCGKACKERFDKEPEKYIKK
ncbi:YHS domain-containing protein [Emticicia sp. BO119]|uniref:YHS domain-containing protein n=1 Tax=Emticicia sp. BO119 TaxID=2757768 RepID=UPI0015F095C9|nr:YHS domain-containing protein [Emticicia sp. BO119]MBA4853410.1 YHS domain-containing protein [Emticicia sp. BO119]